MSRNSRTKATPYTPVFYTTPRSSVSATESRTDVLDKYLDCLSRKHIALAQIVQEMPSSRCGSPIGEEDQYEDLGSKARVDALVQRVRQAFQNANGEPADGKWAIILQLLQLTSTKGRSRWVGTTLEGKKAESSIGWVNADTEEEWTEWETTWNNARLLQQKVESWQQKVEFDPAAAGESPEFSDLPQEHQTQTQKEPAQVRRVETAPVVAVREQKSSALNFPVVKRSSLTTIGKPAKATPVSKLPAIPSPRLGSDAQSSSPNILTASSSAPGKVLPQEIADVSETSFLPPSFPNALHTSTPNPRSTKRCQPAPIPLASPTSPRIVSLPLPSPPVSSPPNILAGGQDRGDAVQPSSSLTDLPSTPTRHPIPKTTDSRPIDVSLSQSRGEKRSRPHPLFPDDHAAKRARTAPPPPTTNMPIEEETNKGPATPQKLPTLSSLLASSKSKSKLTPSKWTITKKPLTIISHVSETPIVAFTAPHPAKDKAKDPSDEAAVLDRHPVTDSTPAAPHPPSPLVSSVTPAPPPAPIIHPERGDPFLQETSSYAGILNLGPGLDYEGAPSPTKSLSSLAADSDSESEYGENAGLKGIEKGKGKPGIDMDMIEEFDPPFVSTQVTAHRPGKAGEGSGGGQFGGLMGYSSQFDLDGRVDLVSKFMERDVNVDYEGWLRDPSEEPEQGNRDEWSQ